MTDPFNTGLGEQRLRAETDEVILDNHPIPVSSIITSFTSRFESKLTFGDYSKDSDQLQSTWVQSRWTGGLLTNEHTEGATDERGRWGCAWTMSPEQLALPPRISEYTQASGLGEDNDQLGALSVPLMTLHNTTYVSHGNRLWRYFGQLGVGYEYEVTTLPGFPSAQGVQIADTQMMIPLGDDGVVRMTNFVHGSEGTVLATYADIKTTSPLVMMDNRVYAGTTDRYLRVFHTASNTWDAANPDLRVPIGETIQNVVVFWDRSGEQAIYLVTNKALWAYDPEVEKIYRSSLTWPRHKDNARGVSVWRDDALYISTGLGVTRFTRDAVRTDMGLDRDDGIPASVVKPAWSRWGNEPFHAITGLAGAQNFLVATVQLGRHFADDTWHYPYAICVWNEAGWHTLYEGEYTTDNPYTGLYPSGLSVDSGAGGYRIWWGMSAVGQTGIDEPGTAFEGNAPISSLPIPHSFHAPRMRLNTNGETGYTHSFADSGYYETGWFDAGMSGFDKTWSHFEITLDDPGDGSLLNGSVEVFYRTNRQDHTWTYLGTANQYGRTVFAFGRDADGFPAGITSRDIDIRIELSTGDANVTPVINNYILKFIKLPLPGRAWQFTVPFDSEDWRGMGPNEMKDWLTSLTHQGGFSWFMVKTNRYRARVSQVQIVEPSGDVPYKQIQVNLIEVTIPGDPEYGGFGQQKAA